MDSEIEIIEREEATNQILRKGLENPVLSVRNLCKESLYFFLQALWETYSTDELVLNWHLKYLSEECEDIAKRVANKEIKLHDLIINITPGTTKTALVSIFFPVWCWINWYWMKFITGSYSAALSLESAEYSRDIIRSEKFKMLFPEIDIRQDKDTKSNFRVVKKKFVNAGRLPQILQGGQRISTSVGGTITGFHAHIIIPDDPLNPEQAASEVETKKANRWVDQTLSTRKTNKEVTTMIMIQQRLHQNDPTGHLLEKKKGNIKHISIPGEIREYGDCVQPPELKKYYVDDLFDPIRMNWKVLEEMKADLGQYGYAAQVGQKPTPPAGGMFKVDMFIKIETLPPDEDIVDTVRYWDKAGTKEKVDGSTKGAYTVGCKIHKLIDNHWVIADVVRGRWSSDERENIIKATAEADGRIVRVRYEQEPGSGGKESAENTTKMLAGFDAMADRPVGDKIYRADPFSVQVNNGNVMLLKGEWNTDFIEEHRFFPFSTYKDQVDAAGGGFAITCGKGKKQVKAY